MREIVRTALIAVIGGVVSLLVERLWHKAHARARRNADATTREPPPDGGAGDGDAAAD